MERKLGEVMGSDEYDNDEDSIDLDQEAYDADCERGDRQWTEMKEDLMATPGPTA